jgi:hypothetical protein
VTEVGATRSAEDPALAVALAQEAWYAVHRDRARYGYWLSEVLLLVAAAATTLAAALSAVPWITAALAATTVVLTGLRKIFDWQAGWISYANSWIEIRRHINSYRLIPEDQRGPAEQKELLRQLDEIASSEISGWTTRKTAQDPKRE